MRPDGHFREGLGPGARLGAVQLRRYDECTWPDGSTNEWCGLMTISGVGTTYASGAARG